jgi:hypothetical protein
VLKTTVTEQKSKTSQIASQAAIAEREAAAALEGNITSLISLQSHGMGTTGLHLLPWPYIASNICCLTACCTLHLAAEKSKGEAMERVLAAEQNKVTDLNNKLSFYGDAYKRLQGKLAGAETAVTNIKKELAAQKKKYTELANKFAMTVKELEGGYCICWWLEPT